MSSLERYTGRVKWFNNKAGYGFITVTDGPKSGTDVFVHHSCINVHSEQYKYLVQGEYIEFNLSDTKTDNHQFQAGEVSGIKGGKLMCETRCETKSSRNQYNINELDLHWKVLECQNRLVHQNIINKQLKEDIMKQMNGVTLLRIQIVPQVEAEVEEVVVVAVEVAVEKKEEVDYNNLYIVFVNNNIIF